MTQLKFTEDLVSTIIPVHNRPRLVVEAIQSVLGQTWRPIEILVIDDGSTDDTLSVLTGLAAKHPEIQVFSQENFGPGAARQVGVNSCRGEFIQFLDSDDLLMSEKFERQVIALRQKSDAGACYGWTLRYPLGDRRSDEPVKWTGKLFEAMFPSFLADRWWDTSTPLYRADLIRTNGPWLNLCQEEDWEYDCRLAARGVRLARVEVVVSETRVLEKDRLSGKASTDPMLLRDRCVARAAILDHASRAGIGPGDPHMRCFLDGCFLVARQAALAGLEKDSARLIGRLNAFDGNLKRRVFQSLAGLLGQSRFTKLAEAIHSWSFRRTA